MTGLLRVGQVAQRPDPVRAVYTVTEVAQLLSLSRGSAYELVRDGTIPAHRLGRRWVIPKGRFHAWLDGQGGGAEVSPPVACGRH